MILPMLTRKQKEESVIQLLEQGKTSKEITAEVHVCPNFITPIRRKLEGDESQPSIRNQAYQMFLEGKKPIDVAIALQIDSVEAIRYWKEYLQLKQEYTLLKIRNEFDGDFSQFINLYMEMKRNRYSLKELKRALETVRKTDTELIFLMEIEEEKKKRQEEVNQLEGDIKMLSNDISVLKSEKNCLEIGNRLLFLSVQSLMQKKVNVEKQLTRLYDISGHAMDKQLVPYNNFDIDLLPSSGAK